MFEFYYKFEELRIPLLHKPGASGLLLYGEATIDGDDDGYTVTSIRLEGGVRLRAKGAGHLGLPAPFEEELFKRIATVLESTKTSEGKQIRNLWVEQIEERAAA